MIKSWILDFLTQDLANGVIYVDTRAEIKFDLKECYSQLNVSHLFQIERDIISLR